MKVVVSLGGSVLGYRNKDFKFLKNFIILIKKYIDKGYKFVIYCGGGELARKFISNGKKLGLNDKSLDWIGIYVTRLNGILLKNLFTNYADNKLIINPHKKIKFDKSIIIGVGWKPGWSTDYDAVLIAKKINAAKMINITNTSHVYDRDPKKYANAKKIMKIKWESFRKLVGYKWKPGLNVPFDPIASKEAEKNKLKVMIIDNNLKKLNQCLSSDKFNGTLIF